MLPCTGTNMICTGTNTINACTHTCTHLLPPGGNHFSSLLEEVDLLHLVQPIGKEGLAQVPEGLLGASLHLLPVILPLLHGPPSTLLDPILVLLALVTLTLLALALLLSSVALLSTGMRGGGNVTEE